jgi:NlpC/P60 family putative phage cell wall peptidase
MSLEPSPALLGGSPSQRHRYSPLSREQQPRREAVLAEARSWLRTPYHHMGRVKAGGADCLTLLVSVYEAVGLISPIELPFYPPDWNLHRDTERYLEGLARYAREIDGPPGAGDVAVFKFGRCFAHGAIVIAWPRLIHAWHDAGVVYVDADQPPLRRRQVRFFSPYAVQGGGG